VVVRGSGRGAVPLWHSTSVVAQSLLLQPVCVLQTLVYLLPQNEVLLMVLRACASEFCCYLLGTMANAVLVMLLSPIKPQGTRLHLPPS
jgi:hypothetical protein